MALIQELTRKKLIHPPKWLPDNMCYATIMGSQAYGVSDDSSDMDIYGFCMPPKHIIFPHLAGVIIGFGEQGEKFEQFQAVNVVDPTANGGKGREYDIFIYNIVRYFHLCMHMNPNMVDSLFTPTNCVIHSTKVGEMVRAARRDFLNKKCWHTFKGYAYQMLKKGFGKNIPARKLYLFNETHNVPETITLDDIKEEISRRGIKIGQQKDGR